MIMGWKKGLMDAYFPSFSVRLNMMRHLIVKGLYFVEKPGDNYLTSFFFPDETPYKLDTTRKVSNLWPCVFDTTWGATLCLTPLPLTQGNATFIQGVRILKENIYVREGLLHIIELVRFQCRDIRSPFSAFCIYFHFYVPRSSNKFFRHTSAFWTNII